MKYSVEQKAQVVSEGLCDLEKVIHRKGALSGDMTEWLYHYGLSPEFRCAHSINRNHDLKVYRLKKRISPVITTGYAIFVTLTFNDETFAKTSSETRRRYVSRFFKSISPDFYVGNIDFGDKEKNPESKEREHYHGVIFSPLYMAPRDMKDPLRLEFQSRWTYGFSSYEPISNSEADKRKISKYVCKLSSHAFKASTRDNRIIYSRSV